MHAQHHSVDCSLSSWLNYQYLSVFSWISTVVFLKQFFDSSSSLPAFNWQIFILGRTVCERLCVWRVWCRRIYNGFDGQQSFSQLPRRKAFQNVRPFRRKAAATSTIYRLTSWQAAIKPNWTADVKLWRQEEADRGFKILAICRENTTHTKEPFNDRRRYLERANLPTLFV